MSGYIAAVTQSPQIYCCGVPACLPACLPACRWNGEPMPDFCHTDTAGWGQVRGSFGVTKVRHCICWACSGRLLFYKAVQSCLVLVAALPSPPPPLLFPMHLFCCLATHTHACQVSVDHEIVPPPSPFPPHTPTRSLTRVVAHEIAHSWTGNLVTNASWEHFWLNEGMPAQACLPTCLPACLSACLPACLPACPAYICHVNRYTV